MRKNEDDENFDDGVKHEEGENASLFEKKLEGVKKSEGTIPIKSIEQILGRTKISLKVQVFPPAARDKSYWLFVSILPFIMELIWF